MKSISNSPRNMNDLLTELEDKLKKIEGERSNGSTKVKRHSTKSLKNSREDSDSGSGSTTPRLVPSSKSNENVKAFSDGSVPNGDPHTPPVRKRQLGRTPRIKEEQLQRAKKMDDDDSHKSSSSTTPRSVRFATSDTPPSTPISHRSVVHTPTTTPRGKKEESSEEGSISVKPKTSATRELRKRVSKSFSKAALNIGKLGEKISSHVSSTSTSTLVIPKSSGRNSPEVHSSSRITEKSNPFPEITPSVKNQAARALIKLESNPDYKNCGDTRKNFMLNSELINVLSNNAIEINTPRLKFLQREALERSKNYEIKTEIDIQTEPYAAAVWQTLEYIESVFGGITGDRGKKYGEMNADEKKEVDFCFEPMFIRDAGSGFVHHKIEGEDGSYKDVSSLAELATYLNQDDPASIRVRETGEVRIEAKKPDGSVAKNKDGSTKTVLTDSLRSKYVSVFTCQNFANLELLVFGGYKSVTPEGVIQSIPSVIKFYDGTRLNIKGMSRTTWSYSKTVDGGVKVKMLIEKTPDPAIKGKKSTLENGVEVTTEDGAIATIEAELYFSADRELWISDLKVHATGWNLPKDM